MSRNNINPPENDWLEIVQRHVAPLDYGSVEIVIHDSKVVQIDKTERWRLQKSQPAQIRGLAGAADNGQF